MPQFSIVIPCYNYGRYLRETIESVEKVGDSNLYELIIVDDGSTDKATLDLLQELSKDGYNIVFSKNGGASSARNIGIRNTTAPYILPLDADNKLTPEYLYKAAEILDNHPEVDIVYSDSRLFGVEDGIRVAGEYNLQRLMIDNFIDTCSVIRREVWETLGGFDQNFETGLEDWEFFLHASFNAYKFHYIPEPLFHYRVERTSAIHQFNNSKLKANRIAEYFIKKHPRHYGPQYIDANMDLKFKRSPLGFIYKIILRNYFPTRFQKMAAQGKLRKYL